MPIVAGTDMKVIALCMSDEGMPQTVDERLKIADTLVNGLRAFQHLLWPACQKVHEPDLHDHGYCQGS